MLLLERYEGETLSRYDRERVQQVRGLLLLALAALLFAVLRAGAGQVFTPGWWQLW